MKYISKKEKLSFYSGLTGQNIVYSFIGGAFFTYFMTDIALFDAAVVTVLGLVMKVWDGINDPLIGSMVDKHVFKSGEKLRPFLKYTPLPVGIFTVLIFLVFSTSEDMLWLRIAYFVIMYICWDIAYTLQDVAIWGITACVSPNSDERDTFVKWARTVGSCVYGIFGGLIPMLIESTALATKTSMRLVTLIFALILGLGGAMLSYRAYGAQERIRVNVQEQQSSLRESFSLLFKNKMLLLLTLSNLFGALGFGGNLMVYFFKYKMPTDFLGANSFIGALGLTTIYGAITYGPQFIGMLFADKLKKIFKGYVNALIFMQALNIVTRVIAFAIGYEGFGIWAGMILMAICCIPMGAVSIAQTSIFCDSIDYMEWKTGKRMEGVAFSMQTFFTKVSSGITMALTTGSLALLGYKAVDDSATVFIGTQTAAFDTWIWPLAMLTPAIASLLYIIPLLFIRYTPEKRAVVEKELKERREATQNA